MIHVVQPGETLYSIGKKYNLSTTELLDINNMKAYDTLSIGQNLLVSKDAQSSGFSSGSSLGQYYVVQRGDSLYSIAKKFNTTPQQLLLLNGLSANQSIYIGQQLKVKSESRLSGNTSNQTVPKVSSLTGDVQYYTVKTGDSLYAIAKRFDTTPDAIQQQNGMSSASSIYPGQRLVISGGGQQSSTTQSGQDDYYTVQKGDTLYAIAQKYNTTPQYILQLNNLNTQSRLSIGQQLKIRETKQVTEPAPTFNPTPEISSDVYTVQRGDSLYAIAQKYGTTPQAILDLNGLAANATIYIGQMLRVKAPSTEPPKTNSNFQNYTVQQGDWLAKIADRFGTTPEEIVRLNNISGGGLYVGQQLLIPSSKSTTSVPSYQSGKAGDIQKARSVFQLQEINGIDIFGTGLQAPVGKVYNNLPSDLEKVQNRLIQLGLLTPNHGEAPNVLKSRLGSSPIGQGSIPKTVAALVKFQSKYRVDYWTKNAKHVQMLGTGSFTSGVVAPNDVTYKVLREYTQYTLVVPHPTQQGRYTTSQFDNFVRSSYNEYYNGIGFRGNFMPDVPLSVFESLGLDENMALALKYVSIHEGNFDAINSYDKANFSWGFIQFAGKGGNTNGSLSAVIATMKNNQPQLFSEFFQKIGIDVDIITRNGEIHDGNLKVYDLHAVTGKYETEGLDAEVALKSDKQLYGAFIRAAYHPQFYTAQLERAVIGYVRPALSIKTNINAGSLRLSDVPLNRIISSPMGSGLMVDLTVNQWINKTRDIFKSAIEKVASRRGINTAGVLQQIDDREVIQQIIADAGSDTRIKTRATNILNSTLSPLKPNFVPPLV